MVEADRGSSATITSDKCRRFLSWCLRAKKRWRRRWSGVSLGGICLDVLSDICYLKFLDPLQWRHNGRYGVSNHQPHDCLRNRLFRRRSWKHQSSASLAFVRGIHRGPVNSPHKWPVTRKMVPFDDVIMRVDSGTASTLPTMPDGFHPDPRLG